MKRLSSCRSGSIAAAFVVAVLAGPSPGRGATCSPTTFITAEAFSAGIAPRQVIAGDFDNDGHPDLLASGGSNGSVSVLLSDGGGGFGVPQTTATPTNIAYVVAGYFDDDSLLDLAVGADSGQLQIMHGNGDGTFTLGDSYPGDYGLVGMAVGDFDGDGHADLALSLEYGTRLEVFLGNGDGTFQPPVVSFPSTPLANMVAGDFDNDGKADLAAGEQPSAVAVSLSLGDGTFGPPTEIEIGPNIGPVQVADLDGDGALDIVAGSDVYVAVIKGRGDGTFNAANLYAVGFFPNALAVADIDGDGRLDLSALMEVGYNYGAAPVAVLHQRTNGLFEDGGSYQVGPSASSLAAADFDGDGFGDLATANFQAQTVSVLFGNGDGNLRATLRVPSPGNAIAIAVEDFTSDGRPDIATLNLNNGSIKVFTRGSNGRFQQIHSTPLNGNPFTMASGRFGTDTTADLAIADSNLGLGIFRGHGDGTFDPPVYYGNGIPMSWMAVADFTGDGNPDIAVVEPTNPYPNGRITVFLGQSDGTFVEGPSTLLAHPASGLVAANIDGGTRMDLATINGGDSLSVYIGFGTGDFALPVDYPTGPNPIAIAAGYMDTTQFPSLVVANGGASNVSVFFPDGGGGFLPQLVVGLGYSPAFVVVADLNGDGHPDVATVNPATSNVSELLNNFDRTFKAPTSYAILPNPMAIAAGPLFGTVNDLVVGDQYGDAFTILQNSHVSVTAAAPAPPIIVNSSLTLQAFASGFGPLTYLWRQNGVPLADGGRFSGTATSSLTIDPVLFTDVGTIDVAIIDSCSSALSELVPFAVEFDDVPLENPFHNDIITIATAGITGGCNTGSSYCPSNPVSRAEMAVLLLKAKYGADHVPPPPPPVPIFPDVPADAFAAAWIDELATLGITAGCGDGNGNYCPDAPVTRGQMAVFLLKTLIDSGYVPPPAVGLFSDVPLDYFAIAWIEDLYNRGITAGCGSNPLQYCPDANVPREQMATFIVRTFLGP